VTKQASTTDPLWYKDAIIYELHVRAFADSNNDGIGDFPGLISKLDYLQELGVTCIWLLPFFPSPLRDDGYDISNYTDVNPSYGTLADFKAFLQAAHQRNMQLMIELVLNHTSDQHPWFKAARLAPAGSPQRDMYVWSDTDQRYKDARIIFTDTEKSNWTWDETAKAYYWHRFFSHQPDLNYDNPLVMEEMMKTMRFWLDMGVDALRVDAIPYLVERDGTSCENLPETHAVVKEMRATIDAEYANRLILAEANQWPADVRPYFGEGDECHMAFHFPLMPRIYMALRQEDRLPITDIMAHTPSIPDNCQWALFLRNHDELTLEMVTADERDYMYFAYSADPRMRVNVGIRRRLAPLVDNNRRRIELLNSLLFSFPGTPVIYYGDEIGMGDNIYLGDRNGVRTPMQWTSDRNAGFSKCDPARLYFPVIMDPIYGYQAVNVEAQLSEPSSLLRWTHNMIALRKLFQVFGRGTLTFLNPANRRILAYLRDLDRGDGTHETVLCVANLSRFAQPVSLDLSAYAGLRPVEMLGYVPFPPITSDPYVLSLAPYSFLWLELHLLDADAEFDEQLNPLIEEPAAPAYVLSSGWTSFFAGRGMNLLESSLTGWLPKQRWFGAKTRVVRAVRLCEWAELPSASERYFPQGPHKQSALPFAVLYVEVEYTEGDSDLYQLCCAMSVGAAREEIVGKCTENVIAEFDSDLGAAALCDAAGFADFQQDLLNLVERNATLPLNGREIETWSKPLTPQINSPSAAPDDAAVPQVDRAAAVPAVPAPLTAQPGEAYEQARTSAPEALSAGAQSIQPRESPAAGNTVRHDSQLEARAASGFQAPSGRLESRVGSAEQSNTSILYGDRLILKLFRHLDPGENPDVEVGRFLTEVAHFQSIPPFLGEIFVARAKEQKTNVALLQGFVANQGDGWQWFLAQLQDFFAEVLGRPAPRQSRRAGFDAERTPFAEVSRAAKVSLEAADLLGRRTAEMHLALSLSSEVSAFAPEPFTRGDLEWEAERIASQVRSSLEALRRRLAELDDPLIESAGLLLSRRASLLATAEAIKKLPEAGERIRIHGDLHLGQTLRTKPNTKAEADSGDFVIIDFEGEPARPLLERRRKQSPLKDVAGMMRSFSYVAFSALEKFLAAGGQTARATRAGALQTWARWWQNEASADFLAGYRSAISGRAQMLPPPDRAQELLDAYLLEKAMYELLYELNNRPQWLRIPIAGILSL
jgi:maltose alpha-D-glucosyltransferase/alpha-amylase